jgi:hypothetical protein
VTDDKLKSSKGTEHHYATKQVEKTHFDSMGDNTFMREMEDNHFSMPSNAPPSIAAAMKALQNKIKVLEKDKYNMSMVIEKLQKEMQSQMNTDNRKLELDMVELKQHSSNQIQMLAQDREDFKQVQSLEC